MRQSCENCSLLSVERHTIGALLCSGIGLMSADHDLFQRAIVLSAAMVLALIYGALNATICTTLMIHSFLLRIQRFMFRIFCSNGIGSMVLLSQGYEKISAEKIDIRSILLYNKGKQPLLVDGTSRWLQSILCNGG